MKKKNTTTKTNQVYLRALERRDIPRLANWFMSEDFSLNVVSDYPLKSEKLLKNQLLKELALNKFIAAKTQVLVAETKSEISVGVALLKKINWRNRNLELQIYIPREFRQSNLSAEITNKVYSYIFTELNLYKVYTSILSSQEEKINIRKKHSDEPEALLTDYFFDGQNYHDLYIYALYKDDVLKIVTKP